jgi:hypothetical protein
MKKENPGASDSFSSFPSLILTEIETNKSKWGGFINPVRVLSTREYN